MNNAAIKLPSISNLNDREFVTQKSPGVWVAQYQDESGRWLSFDHPATFPTEAEACQALIDTRE